MNSKTNVQKVYYWRGLAKKVLAVAVHNDFGSFQEWTAYIDAVEGKNHDEEYLRVVFHGEKLDKRIAAILFPNLAEIAKWRS